MYIATGDRDGGSLWSLSGGQAADNASRGIFKSTDGGATWSATSLTSTESGSKIYRLWLSSMYFSNNHLVKNSKNSSNLILLLRRIK
ncbi:MAG: hypothetical protein PF445_12075 [Melioribacteraceae bacterium]|nr:hypothetical protein [Melioribacteraceae bacterium]